MGFVSFADSGRIAFFGTKLQSRGPSQVGVLFVCSKDVSHACSEKSGLLLVDKKRSSSLALARARAHEVLKPTFSCEQFGLIGLIRPPVYSLL